MKQQQVMQQAAEQRLADQQNDLQETRTKLAAAEAALQKAKDDAVECSAAAAKHQQALRQQLLEVRGDRLQLQEQLSAVQRSSGDNHELLQQLQLAEQQATAERTKLLQRVQHLQQQVTEQDQQLGMAHHEQQAMGKRLAQAKADQDAAARQAAAAEGKLAAALSAQESVRAQLMAEVRTAMTNSRKEHQIAQRI
jgi:chromosome segregation ATPase